MRRLALISLTVAVAGAAGALALGSRAQGSSSARFDVIFDDARGLIGGQLVKIAGAQAGTIQNVVVTPNFRARVEATVDSRFMPFHQDATCTIRPEGLIAENYVDCDPGSANSPVLRGFDGHPPTVPVDRTTEPVSLLDLFNIFNLPTRERFQAIINELGIATSGRGDDFNAILLRANPTLATARQVISILARQTKQLDTIVGATNTIAAEGATHTAALQRFLEQSAALGTLTAAHSDPLSQAVARLPGLLAAAQPALQQLDTIAVNGTPLLQQLHAAVPALNQVSADLGPFVSAAKPALADLNQTLKQGIPAIQAATPLVTTLTDYTRRSLPGTLEFARLAKNLQQHGFVESFLSITYYIAASLARYDSTSHLLSILLIAPHHGACIDYATKPVAGCSAHYGSAPAYKPSAAGASGGSGTLVATRTPRSASGCSGSTRLCARGVSGRRRDSPSNTNTTNTTTATPAPTGGAAGNSQQAQSGQTLQSLVNYLLK